MTDMDVVLTESFPDGVARITLNRPDIHNAFDDHLIAHLTAILESVATDTAIRVVVLSSRGKSFSAGADLNWMRRMAGYSEAENLTDSRALANLMRTLDRLPKPTIAAVQGSAFGGGVGLISCCDIAVGVRGSKFGLTEVRLGLIPSAISPYVVRAIGARAARRYFLTGERFDAEEAHRMGLLHELTVDESEMSARVNELTADLLQCGPESVADSKVLVGDVDGPITDEMVEDTARRIAAVRVRDEGREGTTAVLEKRKPTWAPGA